MSTVFEPYLEPGDELPPAYKNADSGVDTPDSLDALPSPPSPHTFRRGPPTNNLNISRADNNIKGSYTIDSSLSFPPPLEDVNGRPLNLRFSTENGVIDVVVTLMSVPHSKHPALLDARSQNGSITISIEDDDFQRFHLHAASANGPITLHLPRTFYGPISIHGQPEFSSEVKAVLTTLSEGAHDSTFFAGVHEGSGFSGDSTSWEGDAVSVDAPNSTVRIAWTDGQEEQKGFFGRYF